MIDNRHGHDKLERLSYCERCGIECPTKDFPYCKAQIDQTKPCGQGPRSYIPLGILFENQTVSFMAKIDPNAELNLLSYKVWKALCKPNLIHLQ